MDFGRTGNAPQTGGASSNEARELQDLFDALPVLVSYVDRDLRYVRVNRTYEEWFNRPRHEAEGRTLPELLGELAFERVRPYVERALAGERVTFEGRVPYQSGSRWVHAVYV